VHAAEGHISFPVWICTNVFTLHHFRDITTPTVHVMWPWDVLQFQQDSLKVLCNGFSQNWWKVVSSCLLQYKPVCVINFDQLCHKMLKSRSLVMFLYSYSSAHHQVWRHIRMRLFLFASILIFDKKLFYRFFTTVISQHTTKMLRLQL